MYTPPRAILDAYADVLINFALNSGKGLKPGEVVLVRVPESAKPFYVPLRNTIIRAGGHPLMQFLAEDVEMKDIYELSSDAQLDFFPTAYFKGMVDAIDHAVSVISTDNKYELKGLPAHKIMLRAKAAQPFMKWREEKEAAGQFTWTLGLYGTKAMADDVQMSQEAYWQEIIVACYLDDPNPVQKWRELASELERLRGELNALPIDKIRVVGEGIDLAVGLGKNRQWLGGSGRNIPSFELFISPDWRRTEGEITFNQPLYQYGNRISGVRLIFRKGLIVEATATENESLLKEMIAVSNANKIGEFSLTDGRLSRITKVMGETLYDENMGGPLGNTHLAVGNAYKESFPGELATVTPEEWASMGYNESAVHTDIISTTDRIVTATLEDGSQKVIYAHGQFTL